MEIAIVLIVVVALVVGGVILYKRGAFSASSPSVNVTVDGGKKEDKSTKHAIRTLAENAAGSAADKFSSMFGA